MQQTTVSDFIPVLLMLIRPIKNW